MAKYQRFEDLPVWQEASQLYNAVLDLFTKQPTFLSYGFRNQLDRASLSISNNIAEGFERVTTKELLHFLAIARGSAGEVRSMIAVVFSRPTLNPLRPDLDAIRARAESCARQLMAWTESIENSSIQGRRHLTARDRERKRIADNAAAFRRNFYRDLPKNHPLYHSREAREARGEAIEE